MAFIDGANPNARKSQTELDDPQNAKDAAQSKSDDKGSGAAETGHAEHSALTGYKPDQPAYGDQSRYSMTESGSNHDNANDSFLSFAEKFKHNRKDGTILPNAPQVSAANPNTPLLQDDMLKDSLQSGSSPKSKNPFSNYGSTNANHETKRSASQAPSHVSIDSFPDFVEKWRYENGYFITTTGERYEVDRENQILRNEAGKPVNAYTGEVVPLERATRFQIDFKTGTPFVPKPANYNEDLDDELPDSEIEESPRPMPKGGGAVSATKYDDDEMVNAVSGRNGNIGGLNDSLKGQIIGKTGDNGIDGIKGSKAKDVNLQKRAEGTSSRPFKPLDWVDRHFIWMHEHTVSAALLWVVPIVGWYMNLRAHWRHGMSYNAKFAQQPTPDQPVKGVYFQDKQSDETQSMRHALRAYRGAPSGYTKEYIDKYRKDNLPRTQSETLLAKELLEQDEGRPMSRFKLPVHKFPDESNDYDDDPTLWTQNWLQKHAPNIEAEHVKKAVVVVDMAGQTRQWMAFRKGPDKDNPQREIWTLVDASEFIINAKKGEQPKISPVDYLMEKAKNENFVGCTVLVPQS